jgi:hypothetical protein
VSRADEVIGWVAIVTLLSMLGQLFTPYLHVYFLAHSLEDTTDWMTEDWV